MVDMPDYAHPETGPSPWTAGLAVNQLQNYFNNQQLQQDQASAGRLAATGNYSGAASQLLGQGHFEQAAQMQTMLRNTTQDQLNDYNVTHQKLGDLAMIALASNDPVGVWNSGLPKMAAATGVNPSAYAGMTGLNQALAEAKRGTDAANVENQRRTQELAWWKAKNEAESGDDGKYGSIQINKDPLNPQMGILNQKKGTVTDVFGRPIQAPEDSGGGTVQPTAPLPGGGAQPVALSLNGVVPASGGVQPAASNQGLNNDAIKDLSPDQQEQIKAWQEGRQQVPTNPRPGVQQALILKLHSYDPSLNLRDIDQFYNYRKQFMAASGKRQSEGLSFNAGTQHGAEAIDASDWLPSGSVFSTSPQMAWANIKNDPRLQGVIAWRNILAGEAAKLVHGGQSEDTEKAMREAMPIDKGKEPFQAGVANVMQAMAEKNGELEQGWAQNMRNINMPSEAIDMMTPTAKAQFERIKSKLVASGNAGLPQSWLAQKPAPPPPPSNFQTPAPTAPQAIKEGTIQRSPSTGKARIMKDGQWQPLP